MKKMLLVCLGMAAATSGLLARVETQRRTIYFNAVDRKGAPVTDLVAGDVSVAEEGVPRVPAAFGLATVAPRIAVVLDDSGLGLPEVRDALSGLVDVMPGAEIGLFSTVRPENDILDFTSDAQTIRTAIRSLVPLGMGGFVRSGGLGLEALTHELARRFEKEASARPVIVMLSVDIDCTSTSAELTRPVREPFAPATAPCGTGAGGPGGNTWPQVVRQIQRSGVSVFSIAARHHSSGDHPALLDAGPEVSGGMVEAVLTDSLIPGALKRIADRIRAQYAVTYNSTVLPVDGAKLKVSVKRPGVSVRAPERVAVR